MGDAEPAITAITPDRRKPARVVVKAGARVLARVEARDVDRLGLRVGLQVTSKVRAGLAEAEQSAAGRAYAARLLAKRAVSKEQLSVKLEQRGLAKGSVARLIGEFERAGLLNDAAFAEAVVADQTRRRPAGRGLLLETLSRRGICGDVAGQAVEAGLDGRGDERSRAMQLVRGETGRRKTAKGGDAAMRRKVYALLLRRGFDQEIAAEAVNGVMGDADEPASEGD